MLTLTLPALELAATIQKTPLGDIVIPGHEIPAKQVEIDPQQVQKLILAARQAAANAYAPYSRFRVGSAVIMADDPEQKIRTGSNIENSTYGATACAERTGLTHCAALGFRRLKYIAVSTADALHRPLSERSPCGICRQVIKEFCDSNIATDTALILIDNSDPAILCEIFDIERILPYGFNFAGPQNNSNAGTNEN